MAQEDAGAALVVVVEDDDAVRDSLRLLLEATGHRCLCHDSAEALLSGGLPPDAACLLLDLRLPRGMDGIALLETLRRGGIGVPALVMSGHGDIAQAVRAMRAGASDFIEKPYSEEALLSALSAAMAGGAGAAVGAAPGGAAAARTATLSPREREVLAALAEGLPNKLIAHRLGISIRTVEVHRARMMDKLAIRSLGEAVRLAVAAGLVR